MHPIRLLSPRRASGLGCLKCVIIARCSPQLITASHPRAGEVSDHGQIEELQGCRPNIFRLTHWLKLTHRGCLTNRRYSEESNGCCDGNDTRRPSTLSRPSAVPSQAAVARLASWNLFWIAARFMQWLRCIVSVYGSSVRFKCMV